MSGEEGRERWAKGLETAGLVLAVTWIGGWLNAKLEALLAGDPSPWLWGLPGLAVFALFRGAAGLVRRGGAG